MADKPISIRVSDEQLKLLKKRVVEVNAQVPEANVSINSICKYALDEYMKGNYRKNVEVQLVFPFYDKIGGYIQDEIEEANNTYFGEEDKVYYSAEKIIADEDSELHRYDGKSHLDILEAAFRDIYFVLNQADYNIPNDQIKPWGDLVERLSSYNAYHDMLEKAKKNF